MLQTGGSCTARYIAPINVKFGTMSGLLFLLLYLTAIPSPGRKDVNKLID